MSEARQRCGEKGRRGGHDGRTKEKGREEREFEEGGGEREEKNSEMKIKTGEKIKHNNLK